MLVVQIGAGLALIPKFGLVGAAWASTLTYAIEPAVETWYFCKITGLSVQTFGDHVSRISGNYYPLDYYDPSPKRESDSSKDRGSCCDGSTPT
ncbi:MAG: polysaccharide biosynthesis C-terminal domain-containing protein [Candidatus Eremiobacteraeota bacterium]|nr:polysaccharide biosynthesis C-terminal domain-containing protein [Candidatus Eremiobacteraeota bacterium]MBC5826073.1 polysaccharide biosynthesis C-terminal domain-containing protein [Candidatus Eremiobacteraeota bacterium]